MSEAASLLVLCGAVITFGGSLGLVRLKTFFERVHPATMATTLGAALILGGSMLQLGSLHELLIGAFITATTPISYILLVAAARRRRAP